MTTIQAIETRYAGCRFRSRLEARWAVFFDALGIKWQYEPQGYEGEGFKYLPDFWLPELLLFAEVKGVMSHADFIKTVTATPHLREPFGQQVTQVLLVLGPIPRPGRAWTHIQLNTHAGHVLWQQVFFFASGSNYYTKPIHLACSLGPRLRDSLTDEDTRWFREMWLEAAEDDRLRVDPYVDAAYAAARAARFEFGESG